MEREIFNRLVKVREGALALYSQFRVAALLETASGKLYAGCNIESSSYSLTVCAERVALFKALSEGERQFQKIYILSDADEPCPPCGACRQVLMDFAPELQVVMFSRDGKKKVVRTLRELLPMAFTANALPKK